MTIESRFPTISDPAKDMVKVTAALKGKWPQSVHAQCDMLDGAAVTEAKARHMTVIAVAGEAKEVTLTETRETPVEREEEVSEPNKKRGLPAVKSKKKVWVTEKESVKVPALVRDYWCVSV